MVNSSSLPMLPLASDAMAIIQYFNFTHCTTYEARSAISANTTTTTMTTTTTNNNNNNKQQKARHHSFMLYFQSFFPAIIQILDLPYRSLYSYRMVVTCFCTQES